MGATLQNSTKLLRKNKPKSVHRPVVHHDDDGYDPEAGVGFAGAGLDVADQGVGKIQGEGPHDGGVHVAGERVGHRGVVGEVVLVQHLHAAMKMSTTGVCVCVCVCVCV